MKKIILAILAAALLVACGEDSPSAPACAAYVASTTPACRAGPQLRVLFNVLSTALSILSRAVARRGARRGRCARGPCRACAPMRSSSGETSGILREFY